MKVRSYLPLLEGLSGQVSPAGRLEEGDVASGLLIALLLQLSLRSRPEEDLQGHNTGQDI